MMRTCRATAVLLLLAVAGCGDATPPLVCEPPCPDGTHCTTDGCKPDDDTGPQDLAVRTDLSGCSQACAGATPHCGPNRLCVACLEDSHCPAGQVCQQSGQFTVCVPGCADDSRCNGGLKCCGMRCIDVSKDTQNCGGCGNVCGTQHSTATCVGGMCAAGNCHAGWGECNMNPADGCETNLRADPRNCTACGMVCSIPNAISGCASGAVPPCYIAACNFGFDDCNGDEKDGCETKVLSDLNNCGECAKRCVGVPHASIGCLNGTCALTKCDPGYADCDRNPANGCEIGTGTDKNNCGMCGMACGQQQVCINSMCTCPPCNFPNAQSACVNNNCALGQCNPGFANCDGNSQNGCEQATNSDVRNCGACGVVCAQGLICTNGSCTCPQCNFPNGQSQCVNNQCVLTGCVMGFGNCDNNPVNGCEANLSSDSANCNACGLVCPQGQTCQLGMCSATIHNTIQFVPQKTAANTCAFNNSGAIKWTDLGQMTWKQCTVEASKRSAMMTATNYTNPAGWYSHRNGANAMTGVWSNYRSQPINTPFACVVGWDPNVAFDPLKTLANTTTYDNRCGTTRTSG